MEIVGQLSGQMAEMVGGLVETVGEEPEPESEGTTEQHGEEEELTRVSNLNNTLLKGLSNKIKVILYYFFVPAGSQSRLNPLHSVYILTYN